MLMRWVLVGPQIASGWGLAAQGTNHVIRGLDLLVPPLTSGQRRGVEIKLVINGYLFNQSCLHNRTSITSTKQ